MSMVARAEKKREDLRIRQRKLRKEHWMEPQE